jgi:hypothetical protein
MKKGYQRRDFLGKLGLGLSSVVALPILGMSKNENEETMSKEKILRIKPLGFQWGNSRSIFVLCSP